MTSLILKTILRVLIIFLPVISLSFMKDAYSQQPDNIVILGLGVMIILGIILVFIWYGRKTKISRSTKDKNTMQIKRLGRKEP